MEYICIEKLHNIVRVEKAIFGQPTSPTKCTSKCLFGAGGRDGDTLCTPSPLQAMFAFSHLYFKMFLERFLNGPHSLLPHFKYLSPFPHPSPPPPHIKNFNRTLRQCTDLESNFSTTVLLLVFRKGSSRFEFTVKRELTNWQDQFLIVHNSVQILYLKVLSG